VGAGSPAWRFGAPDLGQVFIDNLKYGEQSPVLRYEEIYLNVYASMTEL
jgi:hypothetical protein